MVHWFVRTTKCYDWFECSLLSQSVMWNTKNTQNSIKRFLIINWTCGVCPVERLFDRQVLPMARSIVRWRIILSMKFWNFFAQTNWNSHCVEREFVAVIFQKAKQQLRQSWPIVWLPTRQTNPFFCDSHQFNVNFIVVFMRLQLMKTWKYLWLNTFCL